jgi:hypothetical protein
MDAGPKNGPTPKGLVRGSADAWAISRRGAGPYRFGSDLSEAEASEPLFLGSSSPRAVSRAANPAATTAAVAAFFATCLSFERARRGAIFFAFRAVFAFVVVLAFDLAAARFEVDLAVFDLVLLLPLVFDFPRLTAFFMMPPACVDGPKLHWLIFSADWQARRLDASAIALSASIECRLHPARSAQGEDGMSPVDGFALGNRSGADDPV